MDEVFKAKGRKLWTIDPYDYRQDGTIDPCAYSPGELQQGLENEAARALV